MIKYRFFSCFLDRQQKWLNVMAKKGLRLMAVSGCKYEFVQTSDKYEYCIDIMLDRTEKDANGYIDFLHENGYKTFRTKVNLNESFGKRRLRLGNENNLHLGKMNKEVLIIEKKEDDESFEIYTTNTDRCKYYKRLRNMFLPAFILCSIVMADGLFLSGYICKNTGTLYFSIILFICLLVLILFYQSKIFIQNRLEE